MPPHPLLIIGAGAAGLMCAITAAKRGLPVHILDHANKPGKKILLSGGGRCNFTNRYASPQHYLSHNPHFCISALKRYPASRFEQWVQQHGIAYHEKKAGQLFCDHSAKDLLNALLQECKTAGVTFQLSCEINKITASTPHHFQLHTTHGLLETQALVIATGGLSFPTMGASPFGYKIAEQFGIPIQPVRAGLVPLTLRPDDLKTWSTLSGLSLPVTATTIPHTVAFSEDMLFTHRGLSGPAILQISSYWQAGHALQLNLLPEQNAFTYLTHKRTLRPQATLKTILSEILPSRWVELFCAQDTQPMQHYSDKKLQGLAEQLHHFTFTPNGTEGYRTAEVTLGGVDTQAISSKTFEVKHMPGLYFIGEVLDVTGHLGGFNFQWAFASGFCCGEAICS